MSWSTNGEPEMYANIAAEGEAAPERVAEEDAVAEQAAERADRLGDAARVAVRGGERLAQSGGRGRDEHHADPSEKDEDAAPRRDAQHLAADDGREDRREAVHEHEQREEARGGDAGVHVAHDRPRDHDPRRPRDALGEAQHDEHRDRGRERAQERRDGVRGDPDEQRPAAAEAVAQRAGDDLPEREAGEAGGERELDRPRRRVEAAAELGQPRQVHVDRERPERAQRAEDQATCARPPRRGAGAVVSGGGR
jgi:hypothetical protein